MNRTSINPGRVEWCGENPFIQLQEGGSVSALALFFRIVLSPYGRGCAGLVLGAPHRAAGWPDAPNLLMTDNQRLLRRIVDGWVNGMPAFRDLPGLGGMTWIDLEESLRIPDPAAGRHTESLSGAGVSVELIWDGLGAPFAVEAGETACRPARMISTPCWRRQLMRACWSMVKRCRVRLCRWSISAEV